MPPLTQKDRSFPRDYLLIAIIAGTYFLAEEFEIIRRSEQARSMCLHIDLSQISVASSNTSYCAHLAVLLKHVDRSLLLRNQSHPVGIARIVFVNCESVRKILFECIQLLASTVLGQHDPICNNWLFRIYGPLACELHIVVDHVRVRTTFNDE
jgi:hypothetical protein